MLRNIFVFIATISVLPTSLTKSEESTEEKQKPIRPHLDQKYYNHTDAMDYYVDLVKSPAFIDKTQLIKFIFQERVDRLYITAPNGFGKTSNLYMLKTFLEVEVNKKGEPVKDIHKPVRFTKNYNLFAKKKLRIRNVLPIMKKRFGRYPVIFVDFKVFKNCPHADTYDAFYLVTHNAFQSHGYLLNSKYLRLKDKEIFGTYYNSTTFRNVTEPMLMDGLYFLSRVLSKHFKQPVVFLVDELDTPINNAIITKDPGLDKLVDLYCCFVTNFLKDNKFTYLNVLMGISHITGGKATCYNFVYEYRFLEEHSFVKSFGVTRVELGKLFKRANITDELTEFEKTLAGHKDITNTFKIYSMTCVQNYLKYKMHSNFSRTYGSIYPIKDTLHFPILNYYLEKLVKYSSVDISLPFKTNKAYINDLQNLIDNKKYRDLPIYPPLYFLFLLELGYLHFVKVPGGKERYAYWRKKEYKLSIPNELTKAVLTNDLNEFYESKNISVKHAIKCAELLNKIDLKTKPRVFKKFKDTLQELIDYKNIQRDIHAYHSILHIIISKSDHAIYIDKSASITIEIPKFILYDEVGIEKTGILIKLKTDSSPNEIVATAITDGSHEIFNDDEKFPSKNIVHKVIIGISVDENQTVSLGYDKIVNNKITNEFLTID